MPIYEYECEKCLLRFELRRRFDEDGEAACPRCRGDSRRLFSPVPVVFKGTGFYVTDSRSQHGWSSSEAKINQTDASHKTVND